MAIIYRTYQDNRENSLTAGQWFGRAVHTNTVDLEAIGEEIQENVSVKYSDVMGVLIELINVMNRHLNASEVVKLNGFGSFKIGLTSKGARSAKAFTVQDNITGMHVVFTPERSTDAAGNRVKQFLQGAKCEELPENKVEKEVQGE